MWNSYRLFCANKFQDWWDAHLESGGYGFWLSYVPKVLLAVVIALMDEAYFKVAVWLNDLGMYFDKKKSDLHYLDIGIFFLALSFPVYFSFSLPLSSVSPSSIDLSFYHFQRNHIFVRLQIQRAICRLFRIGLCISTVHYARLVREPSIYFR